jgi:glucosyl-dolichyl phosphate glucuronosyltransferase
MKISVIVSTYNRADILRTTLETLSNLVVPVDLTWELLIVDNNSTDSTRAVVQHFAQTANFPVRYLFEEVQGKSAALNRAVGEARGEIIAFTDDDVVADPHWLSNLERTFDECDCSAVGGRVVPLWGHAKPDWLEIRDQYAVVNFDFGDERKEIQIQPLGANSAFRKRMFQKYGLFRLDLGPNSIHHTITCEDVELANRLIRGGEKVVYCPDAVIYHPVDPKRTTKSYFLLWYYYNGVSLTRMQGVSRDCIFLFGAPRWLYREMLMHLGRWVLTVDSKQRFYHKLRTYQSIGKIVESRRLSPTAA